MGIGDDAKDVADTIGRKAKDAWEDTKDAVGDKVDEMKAEGDVKRAEAHRDAVQEKNDLKKDLRDSH